MKSASSLPVGKTGSGGGGELSLNESQSRVALFNFRQLCHPLTNNTKLRHTNRKETKYFPNQLSTPSNTVPWGRRKVI